jgi:hypothetical protein
MSNSRIIKKHAIKEIYFFFYQLSLKEKKKGPLLNVVKVLPKNDSNRGW